jgi:hypothetical protein
MRTFGAARSLDRIRDGVDYVERQETATGEAR